MSRNEKIRAPQYRPARHERLLDCELSQGGRLLAISGVLDELAVPELREMLHAATEDYTKDLTVDLSRVDFLPSVALGVLVAAMGSGVARIRLVAQEGTIASRVLAITGLDFTAAGPANT